MPGLVSVKSLCCAVLCCAVLCCAVLCCAAPCCAVLCCAVLRRAVLCCPVLCRNVPCRAVPCRAMPCCAVLCCACCACCAVLTTDGYAGTYKASLMQAFERTVKEARFGMVLVDAPNVSADDLKGYWSTGQVPAHHCCSAPPTLLVHQAGADYHS